MKGTTMKTKRTRKMTQPSEITDGHEHDCPNCGKNTMGTHSGMSWDTKMCFDCFFLLEADRRGQRNWRRWR